MKAVKTRIEWGSNLLEPLFLLSVHHYKQLIKVSDRATLLIFLNLNLNLNLNAWGERAILHLRRKNWSKCKKHRKKIKGDYL